jgi:hypothetical protein
MTDTPAANESEFKIDSAEINALLQARGTGQVGAILVENGVPTKNGAKSLFMLRGLAARGLLVEKPAEDVGQKTIVYFNLAHRADLSFLDQCASSAIIDLANKNHQLDELAKLTQGTLNELTESLDELRGHLGELESELVLIRAWATEIQGLAGQIPSDGIDARDSGSAIEAKAKAVAEKIAKMMGK